MTESHGTIEAHGATFDADGRESPGRNAAPAKVQCAECHWQGLSSDLVVRDDALLIQMLACPLCGSPFARYPQRAEHLWSDPY
jgi:hypothetical protein